MRIYFFFTKQTYFISMRSTITLRQKKKKRSTMTKTKSNGFVLSHCQHFKVR